jgi:DNA-binding response OmpR family regulator
MFLTADDTGMVESRCFKLGAVDCIRKPANRDMLLKRLNSRLEEAESRLTARQAECS